MVPSEALPPDGVGLAPSRRGRLVVVAGVILAFAAAIPGCGVHQAASALGAHATAIVAAHHGNELAPELSGADLVRLHAAAADPDIDDVAAYVVAAGRPEVEKVDLEPRRPNGQIERGSRIDRLVDERLAELQRAITRGAEQGTDVDQLRALGLAAQTGAEKIIVLTSGLSSTDPLDMRVSGWDRDPAGLARNLHDRGLLPDLRGRSVTFSGLSRTAGAQPPLGLREQAALRNQWLAICSESGASCRTDDTVRSATPPVSRLLLPVVDVPTVTTTPGPAGVETVSVPTPLLFAPDSCELLDGGVAAAVLEPLAARLRHGAFTVSISGRTAPVGPGDGVELASCRANAAADLLLGTLDVPGTAISEIRGDGSLLDPLSASRDDNGRLDPTKLAALRRVVFTLIPAKESR